MNTAVHQRCIVYLNVQYTECEPVQRVSKASREQTQDINTWRYIKDVVKLHFSKDIFITLLLTHESEVVKKKHL